MSAFFIARSVSHGTHTVQCCRTLTHLTQSISGCCIQEWTAVDLANIPEESPGSPHPLVDYLTPLLEAVKQPSMAAEFELGSTLLGLELRLEALKHLNWQPPPDLCHAQPSGSALSSSQAAASALAPPPESATPLPASPHLHHPGSQAQRPGTHSCWYHPSFCHPF